MANQISWISIPSSDFERAVKFYSAVTNRVLDVKGEGDKRMATSMSEDDFKNQSVGFGVTGDQTIKPGSNGPRVYLVVEDVKDYLDRVEEAGGKILVPRSEMGEMGFWALIEDTEGNQIGLHSMK